MPDDLDLDRAEACWERFHEYIRIRNVEALKKRAYAKDAVMMGPDQPSRAGEGAVQSLYEGMFRAGVTEVEILDPVVEVHGDVACYHANYRIVAGDKTIDAGKKLVFLRKDKITGDFLISHDCWTQGV